MITVLRAYGLRVAIYSFDHDPPHVHVFGDGVVKILLVGSDGTPEIIYAKSMSRADQRKALAAVREAQAELLERWRDIHG